MTRSIALDITESQVLSTPGEPLQDDSLLEAVGCGAGTFLSHVRARHGSAVAGVDFMDLGDRAALGGAEFHCGLFYEHEFERERFDLVTMWHFLEHDYDPMRSLRYAREILAPD